MRVNAADILDCVIIGGGPAGLNAALILARCCKRIVVIDAGHPRNAPARHMHGYLTRDGIPPLDLLELAREEVARYGVEVVHDVAERTRSLGASTGPYPTSFTVETKAGRTFAARKLLLATGMCDDVPEIPGVRECYGVSVHHCPYCDGYEHRGKRLVALGEAADDAIGLGTALRGWSPHVTVVTHGKAITAALRKKLDSAAMAAVTERITRLIHDEGRLIAIEFESSPALPTDALFFNTAQRATCDLAASLGCTFDKNAAAKTTDKQKTCVPGVFLAGDADGDVQFVIVAAAEGAAAAVAINRELQDENAR